MNKELEANTNVSHYRILRKLGAGGMGEVYLAEDTKLDRKVALKILPPEFAADKERMNRFVREAKSASALNHPNIITIHEIGGIDGTHFIATEFIDGKTLTEYLKAHALDYKSALEIAVQVASALDEAHRAGIVHRDVKPDNIMIRPDGLVKILDFGIAKLSGANPPPNKDAEAATALKSGTTPGMIIGTASYMSPEQAAGRAIDARSDVFSFGVVLYEMIAGEKPFAGETAMEMIGAILKDEPPPLGARVPEELKRIVGKCLQKKMSERYQSIKEACENLKEFKQELEFQEKLERSAAPNLTESETQIFKAQATAEENRETNPQSAIRNPKSIVVLPFTNIGADAEDDYFSDGLTEEIISDLSNIGSLRVISRNSAMKLKGAAKDTQTIMRELDVRYILDGSVRKAGQNLRISAQLIDGATDANLWAEKYQGTLDDVFEIQEAVARSIAEALKITLNTEEVRKIEARPISDARAYDLYLRARAKLTQGNPAALDRSIELLKQGLEIIGENELLYAALGYTYYFYFKWISKLDENYLRLGRECMEKVFALNPDSTHGFSLKGFLSYSEGNVAEAVRALKKAVEIEPTNAEALLWLTVYSEYFEGNRAEALKYANEVRHLDPLLPANTLVRTFVYIYSGDFGEEPLSWVERGLQMDINAPVSIWLATIAKAWCGKTEEAIAHADRLNEIAPGWVYTEHALFLKHALRGEKDAALAHYTPDFEKEAEYDCHFALHVAHCFALVGEKEKALDFLETSVRKGMMNHSFIGKYDPLLENIRREPRFKELIEEAKRLSEQMSRADFQADSETVEEEKTQILQAAQTNENQKSEQTTNPKSEIRNPKSKWWLFGLLGLIVLVGGFFGYKYLTPASKQIESIAVMPFENRSGSADSEYLSDGLAESLIYRLSQLPNLKVSPTSSVFRYKGKVTDAEKIGNELGVRAVMSGRLIQRGDNLTISVELIDVAGNKTIWGEQYERKMSDLLATQREIAVEITNKLQLKLSGEGEQKLAKKYTDNNQAYQLYLKGRFYWNKRDEENLRKAIEQFKAAAEKDPDFALAFVGLADSYVLLPYYSSAPSTEVLPQAKAYAERALEIDDSLGEAHTSLGYVSRLLWNWAEAEKQLKRGIELNPNYATAHKFYGNVLNDLGRRSESLAEYERAQELEPLSLIISANLAEIYLQKGDLNAAAEQCRRAIELDPNWYYVRLVLALVYLKQGRGGEAATASEKSVELSKRQSSPLGVLGYIYTQTGKRSEAAAIVEELKERYSKGQANGYDIARVYVGLGDKDQAFAWLEKDFQSRNATMPNFLGMPPFDSLRDDPRFKNLNRRIGLPELK